MRARSFISASCAIAGVVALVATACSSFTADAESSNDAAAAADGTLADAADVDATQAQDAGISPPPNDAFVLGQGFGMLSSIAANEASVFVGDQGAGRIFEISLENGGVPTELGQVMNPTTLAVSAGGALFWGDTSASLLGRIGGSSGSAGNAQIITTNMVQPTSIALATPEGQATASRLLLGGANLTSGFGEVQHYDPNTLIGVANTSAPPMPAPVNLYDVTSHEGTLYFTDASRGRIYIGTVAGTTAPAELVSGETDCRSIAADAAGVYWARPQDGVVRWRLGDGSNVMKTLAGNQDQPRSLAADASGVYWMTGDGFIRRHKRSETPPQVFAQGFQSAFINQYLQTIALTSKYVVWITTDGKVLRAAK